jgi:hypothetical protein
MAPDGPSGGQNRPFGFQRGVTVASRSQFPPAGVEQDSDSVVATRVRPNATRLIRLMRVLAAWVGPLLRWARCQTAIWCFQRSSVRPSERTSTGQLSSCRSRPRRSTRDGVLVYDRQAADDRRAPGRVGSPQVFRFVGRSHPHGGQAQAASDRLGRRDCRPYGRWSRHRRAPPSGPGWGGDDPCVHIVHLLPDVLVDVSAPADRGDHRPPGHHAASPDRRLPGRWPVTSCSSRGAPPPPRPRAQSRRPRTASTCGP